MQRTLWSGHISFDLLYIPVKLCPAAREKRIQFHYVYGIDGATSTRAASAFAGSAVSNVLRFPSNDPAAAPIPEHVARVRRLYAGMDGVPLESGAIFRAVEPTPGRFAVFRDADLKPLRAPTSSTIEIAMFVRANEVDPKYFELSYDLCPDRDGEELYELFFLGLRDNGFYAIGEMALFGRERWVAIRPGYHGLALHTLYYDDEVRLEEEYHIKFGRVSKKNRELAGALMRAHQGKFNELTLKNKHDEQLLEFVLTRCEESFVAGADSKVPRPARVVNIADALRKSLKLARKPPHRQGPGRGPRKRRNPRGGRS